MPRTFRLFRCQSLRPLALFALLLLVTACTKDGDNVDPNSVLRPIRVGVPFQPDVQFAPVYLAAAAGHFADAGLEVALEYGSESDFVRLVAAGEMDAAIVSGEQVILARANDIPVTYVMSWYQRFPVVVFGKSGAFEDAADLRELNIGLPMLSGASYIGWQALLAANDLDEDQVDTEVVGFDQLNAVCDDRVDAAVGYAANEPVRTCGDGEEMQVLEIADEFNVVSNGLIVNGDSIGNENADKVYAGLVKALILGIRDSLSKPDKAFEAALDEIPEIDDDEVRGLQREVLEASLRFWEVPKGEIMGLPDADQWRDSVELLVEQGLIKVGDAPDVRDLIDDRYAAAADVTR